MRSIKINTRRVSCSTLINLYYKTIITNSHSVIRNLDFLTEVIGSIILAIKDQFNEMATGRPIQSTSFAHSQSEIITDHGFIGIIGNQDPRFILMFT